MSDDTFTQAKFQGMVLESLGNIKADIARNSAQIESLQSEFHSYTLTMEHRLSTQEVKAKGAGAVFGVISGIVASVTVALILKTLIGG